MKLTMAIGCGLALLIGVSSCRGEISAFPWPDHCANQFGNDWCLDKYDDGSRPYCRRGIGDCGATPGKDGCVADRPDDACYSPCGGMTTVLEDGECLIGASSSGSGSSSGSSTDEPTAGSSVESSTTGPMPCVSNGDCLDVAAPLCEPVGGVCVACDAFGAEADAACAGLDPMAPLCLDGACVQCTAAAGEACTGTTPVCDDATNTCVPCTEHDQCGDAACNLFSGACLPSDAVAHVGPGQTYTTISEAVSSFDMMTEGTIIVHAGNYNDQPVTVDGGRVLGFLAADLGPMVTPPQWAQPAGGSPQLTVGDGTVLVDGLRLSGNANDVGLLVDVGQAWVDRSRIVQNSGGGIVAQNAAELVLRNCFVAGTIDTTVLDVQGAVVDVLYSTLGASLGASTALTCDAASTVTVRNGLVVSRDAAPEVVCTGLTASNTAAEMTLGGTDNVGLGDMSTTWFQDYNAGDLHLVAGAPLTIGNAARWEDGDPATDIDGEARPQLDGAPDAAGADVP